MASLVSVLLLLSLGGRAGAAVYWGGGPPLGRANLDGTNPEAEFIRYVPFPSTSGTIAGCGGIAVDASHVFWADPRTGTIGRAGLDGSDPSYSFIGGAASPCGVAVDGAHVYWANFGRNSIGRANLDGTEPNQDFVDAVSTPCGVAVDGKFLYWTSAGSHYVGRALLQGGEKDPHLVDGDDSFAFCGIAVDGEHIFWGGFGNEIGRMNLDGSDIQPSFVTGIERPCGIAVGGGRIYWTEQTIGSRIASTTLDGGMAPQTVLTGLSVSTCGIAVDGRPVVHVAPPSPSWFGFGKVRYNPKSGVAVVPMDFPGAGYLHIRVTSGVSWSLLPDPLANDVLPSGGKRWLKLWPGGHGGNGRRIRQSLRRRGRTTIVIEVEYGQDGHALTRKGKRISLYGRAHPMRSPVADAAR